MSQSGPPKERNTVISVLGEIMDFKITGAETAGALCVVELTSFPHNGPPPHIYHREDESFYVVDGKFSFLILTPAGFENLWTEIADPAVKLEGPSGPPSPEIIARLMDLAPKYGLEIKSP